MIINPFSVNTYMFMKSDSILTHKNSEDSGIVSVFVTLLKAQLRGGPALTAAPAVSLPCRRPAHSPGSPRSLPL